MCKQRVSSTITQELFHLIDPDRDAEIRPEAATYVTQTSVEQFSPERFERFSRWTTLLKAVSSLIHVARSFKSAPAGNDVKCKGWHHCDQLTAVELLQANNVIIQSVQGATFPEEIKAVSHNRTVSRDSPLSRLNEDMDEGGIIRVGGRLPNAEVGNNEKHPLILPCVHHIPLLLICHHHEKVCHQGASLH